jgi:hypothetical protein
MSAGQNIEEPTTPFGFSDGQGRWNSTSRDWDGMQARDHFAEQRAWWGKLSETTQRRLRERPSAPVPAELVAEVARAGISVVGTRWESGAADYEFSLPADYQDFLATR